ncbi:MAG: DUF2769 domain-containing protein [Candidatus Hodarchaeota archaeon]
MGNPEEDFTTSAFEEKMKMLAYMSEADQQRSAENVIGFCEDFCKKCPSYEGTGETKLAFCTLGKSSVILEQKGCLCPQCPIFRTMSLRWNHYCSRGNAIELSEAECK